MDFKDYYGMNRGKQLYVFPQNSLTFLYIYIYIHIYIYRTVLLAHRQSILKDIVTLNNHTEHQYNNS